MLFNAVFNSLRNPLASNVSAPQPAPQKPNGNWPKTDWKYEARGCLSSLIPVAAFTIPGVLAGTTAYLTNNSWDGADVLLMPGAALGAAFFGLSAAGFTAAILDKSQKGDFGGPTHLYLTFVLGGLSLASGLTTAASLGTHLWLNS